MKCPHSDGANSDLTLNSEPVHSNEMWPKVIRHWKEEGQHPKERKSLSVFGITSACGLWPIKSLSASKVSAGERASTQMQTSPELQVNMFVWPESAFFIKKDATRGCYCSSLCWESAERGCIESCFSFDHMGTFLLFPLPFCNSPSCLKFFHVLYLHCTFGFKDMRF